MLCLVVWNSVRRVRREEAWCLPFPRVSVWPAFFQGPLYNADCWGNTHLQCPQWKPLTKPLSFLFSYVKTWGNESNFRSWHTSSPSAPTKNCNTVSNLPKAPDHPMSMWQNTKNQNKILSFKLKKEKNGNLLIQFLTVPLKGKLSKTWRTEKQTLQFILKICFAKGVFSTYLPQPPVPCLSSWNHLMFLWYNSCRDAAWWLRQCWGIVTASSHW